MKEFIFYIIFSSIVLYFSLLMIDKFYSFYWTKVLEAGWCIWITEMVCKEKCSYK